MELDIVWTKRAELGYEQIVAYLSSNFTEKEVRKFIRQSTEFFEVLRQYPEILASSPSHKNLRRGPINKYTILTYRIRLARNKLN